MEVAQEVAQEVVEEVVEEVAVEAVVASAEQPLSRQARRSLGDPMQ